MPSRNNPNKPNRYAMTPEQLQAQMLQTQMQAEMQQRAASERVNAVLINCATQVYAQLVGYAWTASEGQVSDDDYRAMARVAKDAAPFMGEALGMLRTARPQDEAPTPAEHANGIQPDDTQAPAASESPIILP